MQEILNRYLPNVMERLPAFGKAIGDTLIMVAWSGSIAFVLGLVLGVVLIVTRPGGILENKVLYQALDKVINFFRSIPFIILLTWVIPLSRAIMGTAIDVPGAIVPLVLGTVPFFSRQVESALAETDKGLVEAALSMGSSPMEIIFRVYLKESIAAIARGTTITIVSLLNLTAMAGVAGAGGLGNGQLHGALGPGGQPLGGSRAGKAGAHAAMQHIADHIIGEARFLQDAVGNALLLTHQAQQQVLAAHIAVPKPGGVLLGQPQGAQGGGGKAAFWHTYHLWIGFPLSISNFKKIIIAFFKKCAIMRA